MASHSSPWLIDSISVRVQVRPGKWTESQTETGKDLGECHHLIHLMPPSRQDASMPLSVTLCGPRRIQPLRFERSGWRVLDGGWLMASEVHVQQPSA